MVDIRRHGEVAREMVHARHILSGGISRLEVADVALWVGRHAYERGDYSGARKLEEQVLEARRRLLGDEHPDTTISAWNLFQTLLKMGDTDAAKRVGPENLHWLLDGYPATVTGDQQKIRQMLSEMLDKRPISIETLHILLVEVLVR